MGRNAYINFYKWFYNEHRGQAPVTTIARKAGLTWRKMTPQEKDRFLEKNFHAKGKVPMQITHEKLQTFKKKPKLHKGKRGPQDKRRMKSITERKVKKSYKREVAGEKSQAEKNQSESKSIDGNEKEEAKKKEDTGDDKAESEENLARRRSIQKWMDENHYT